MMIMKKKNNKKKNYSLIVLILIGSCVLFIYLFNTFNNYQKEINKNSYLSRTIGEVKYEELDNIFTETSDDYFLYISYVDKDKILDLEKGLKKIILKYNIENNMYFLNVTDKYQEASFYDELNTKLGLKKNKIVSVPAIVYYKDKSNLEVISSTNEKIMEASSFENLLKLYKINIEE